MSHSLCVFRVLEITTTHLQGLSWTTLSLAAIGMISSLYRSMSDRYLLCFFPNYVLSPVNFRTGKKIQLFRTKNLPSFINNRLSSRSSECTAARFKYPANRPGGGGRYSLPLRAVSSPRHSPLSSQPEWTCVA